MGLQRISEEQYARRVVGEVKTHQYWMEQKELELTLLENLKGIADINYYYDSDHNVTDYTISLKPILDSTYFLGGLE